jgi:hypothetical protein
MRVDCPGIKDANSIGSGWVRVTDQNPGSGQDISCLLVSVYRLTSGSSAYAWTNTNGWQKSVGSRPNVQSLSFSAVGGNSFSHYYLGCTIPPASPYGISWIHTYHIND